MSETKDFEDFLKSDNDRIITNPYRVKYIGNNEKGFVPLNDSDTVRIESNIIEIEGEINSDTRKVKLLFFKPSGKYYTEEEREYDSSLYVYQIIENVRDNEKDYSGMHIVGLFSDGDEIGFPFMINADDRRY